MVAFGKELKERQIQEWERYYINYKLMKKKVKHYGQQIQNGTMEPQQVLNDFSRMLDNQIEKIVLFLLKQQGVLSVRLAKLGKKYSTSPVQQHQYRPSIVPLMQDLGSTSRDQQANISEPEICELQEGYREVGQDLIKLLFYVEVNAIGVRKILKKFDKRFGYRFTDYYVKTRVNIPYSQLQQLFMHVGLRTIVGAITRNLGDLQGSYLSIYDQPNLPLQDPVVDSINGAIERLIESTNFLAQHELIIQEEPLSLTEEQVDDQRYHFVSLLRSLTNTFLYMVSMCINLWCG